MNDQVNEPTGLLKRMIRHDKQRLALSRTKRIAEVFDKKPPYTEVELSRNLRAVK